MLPYWVVYYKGGIWLIMKFDEEGMNVFKQAVDNFMAAGKSASFELAGRVLSAARMAANDAEFEEDVSNQYSDAKLAALIKEFFNAGETMTTDFEKRMVIVAGKLLYQIDRD